MTTTMTTLARLRALVIAAAVAIAALWAPSAARADVPRIGPPPGPASRATTGRDGAAAGADREADPLRGAVTLPDAPRGELPLPVERARGRIVVRAQAGLGELAAHLAARADDDLARIAADLPGLPVPARVELRVVRDARDLARAAPPGRGAPAWAAGVAYPDLGVLVVATARGGLPLDATHTTAHELAHLALGAAIGERAPRWLHEGFAWQHSPDLGLDRSETLAGMAWLGSAIPLDELDLSFPDGEHAASRAYAESYDLVSFLSRRGRWEDPADDGDRWPFRRFLRYLAEGDDLDRAAVRAYGRPMRALFEEWRGNLRARYFYFPAAAMVGLLWIIAALLLVLAFLRRRRQSKRRLGEWGEQERRHDEEARVAAPPYVPWPGQSNPLAEPAPTAAELAELASHYPEAVIAASGADASGADASDPEDPAAAARGVATLDDDDVHADEDEDDDDDDDERPDPPRRWIN